MHGWWLVSAPFIPKCGIECGKSEVVAGLKRPTKNSSVNSRKYLLCKNGFFNCAIYASKKPPFLPQCNVRVKHEYADSSGQKRYFFGDIDKKRVFTFCFLQIVGKSWHFKNAFKKSAKTTVCFSLLLLLMDFFPKESEF